VPQQHPHTPTATPLTRREALAAERATPPAPRTPRIRRTPAVVSRPPLPAVTVAAPAPTRTFRSRALAAIPLTGAAAAMALFTAAALPAQASTGPAVTVPGGTPSATGQSFTATGLTVTVDRDGYTVTKPAVKPVITKTTTSTTNSATAAAGSTAAVAPTGTIVNTGAGDIRWPVAGSIRVSSPFGPRLAPCAACSSIHQGADITPGAGTPIGAVAAGTVRISGTHPEYGQYVIIDHQIDGQTISTLYAHMIFGSSPLHAGQSVAVGQLVGLVGNTGASTGAHLHLQVMLGSSTPIDPIAWLTTNAGRTL
jgi:murein DD-endopeptidase MepM/ murein hydrolase activator NlpD